MPTWKCLECGKVQTNQELQCVCGNILPNGFEEVDIYNVEDHPDPVTMVEKTEAVQTEPLVVEDVEQPKQKKAAKKSKKK